MNQYPSGLRALMILALLGGSLFTSFGQTSITFLGQKNDYSLFGYNDVWGYTAPDGREYALLGVHTGTSIIDVTDPANMTEISFILSTPSAWKDIKTYRHYAYVVTEHGPGLQVIDLSSLPDSAHLVRTVTDFMGTSFQTSHNLFVDTSRALLYMEGTASQPVRLWSLADPANPVGVSSFGPLGIQVHDIYARGNRAYVSEGTGGNFGIYDVTTPSSPTLIKRFTSPSFGYAHNAWLSEDGSFLMTTEETEGRTVKYWDISNTDNIQLRGQYLGSTRLAHNTHIKGRYAYISHYKGGLKIVDLANPDNLQEVASYDTHIPVPGDTYLYRGAWGAYPFFNSGKILVSDIERGLFVLFFPSAVVTGVNAGPIDLPETFSLGQNYPNPFNPSTIIAFHLPEQWNVRLSVFDLLGREIARLVDGPVSAGSHAVTLLADELPSGTYLYVLHAGDQVLARRMVLAK